ncbi:hypothetical protein VNO78_19701 [Psophocarpus tetragonolobus]|uniref:AIPP2-like SPOC-like domain-containing protein n=1 Tax=Psophocarpus tetragonolobus TaxID=3891 RepID=A0AAN9SCE1_PSOTE
MSQLFMRAALPSHSTFSHQNGSSVPFPFPLEDGLGLLIIQVFHSVVLGGLSFFSCFLLAAVCFIVCAVILDGNINACYKWHLQFETVCLNCGDVGFQVALILCADCRGYALHRYCLKGPVIFTDSVTCSPKLERPVHSISGEEEREVENGCGPAPSDVDNSDVDFKSVSVSLGATNNDSGCAELGGCVYAQPIIEPIWRGSIYFCNETIGTVSGLLAHMSNLACSKVAEEARHLAEVLHAELVPKSMVWPESFKTREPTDQDIALFFFPDSEGAEKDFDALVDDIISHGHAIRFVAKNAELLIFSSIELPIPCWRFESKYFLWGVFRNNSKFRDQ